MSDLKEKFRDWLLTQKYSQSTINQYIRRIDNICHELYDWYDCRDWRNFSEDAFYFLAQYTEYANKEYYLDFVTTEYALDYFDSFFKTIRKPTNEIRQNNVDVKLYVYHDKKNYFIDNISFNDLHEYLDILTSILYDRPIRDTKSNPFRFREFTNKLNAVLERNAIKFSRKLVIHIVYEKKVSTRQTALSRYCAFLQSTHPSNVYFAEQIAFVKDIKEKNPNKTVNGHYEIEQQISGQYPLKIKAINERDRLDINFTITKQDLIQIFNLDKDTVAKILNKTKFSNNYTAEYNEEDYVVAKNLVKHLTAQDVIIGFDTEIRTYYNADNVNEYLKKHHHYHDNSPKTVNKDSNKSSFRNAHNAFYNLTIDYAKEGYCYWCNRKEALKILGIGKEAFYRQSNLTHLNYSFYATRYYIPELEIMKDFPKIKRVRSRKAVKSI